MMDGDESFYKDWRRWVVDDGHNLIHRELVPKRTFPEGELRL